MYRKFCYLFKNVISKNDKFPHFQKWKEIAFCEKMNFGMSFIIPDINDCP